MKDLNRKKSEEDPFDNPTNLEIAIGVILSLGLYGFGFWLDPYLPSTSDIITAIIAFPMLALMFFCIFRFLKTIIWEGMIVHSIKLIIKLMQDRTKRALQNAVSHLVEVVICIGFFYFMYICFLEYAARG